MNENNALTEAVYYILLSLTKPLHGYGIMQNICSLSNGRINLAAGTLYGALTTMLERGWIIAVDCDNNSRKKEYEITSAGNAVLKKELARLNELAANGEKILGGAK